MAGRLAGRGRAGMDGSGTWAAASIAAPAGRFPLEALLSGARQGPTPWTEGDRLACDHELLLLPIPPDRHHPVLNTPVEEDVVKGLDGCVELGDETLVKLQVARQDRHAPLVQILEAIGRVVDRLDDALNPIRGQEAARQVAAHHGGQATGLQDLAGLGHPLETPVEVAASRALGTAAVAPAAVALHPLELKHQLLFLLLEQVD